MQKLGRRILIEILIDSFFPSAYHTLFSPSPSSVRWNNLHIIIPPPSNPLPNANINHIIAHLHPVPSTSHTHSAAAQPHLSGHSNHYYTPHYRTAEAERRRVVRIVCCCCSLRCSLRCCSQHCILSCRGVRS